MVKIRDDERCLDCNGMGVLRNDDPMSDRIYGEYCSSCNGTGMRSNPTARTLAFWLFIVLNVLSVVVFLKACT